MIQYHIYRLQDLQSHMQLIIITKQITHCTQLTQHYKTREYMNVPSPVFTLMGQVQFLKKTATFKHPRAHQFKYSVGLLNLLF